MFTGLVQRIGVVAAVERVDFGAVLRVDPRGWAHRPAPGDSMAVDGCCLTVDAIEPGGWRFDVIRQTLDATTVGDWTPGRRVNLEPSATPTTLLGGHLVQGHVDGVGTIVHVLRDPSQWRVRIAAAERVLRLVVDRGSVAIDGVSLTVAALEPASAEAGRPAWFEVALIPTTVRETNLGERAPGDRVNIETDCIVRAVAHLMAWRHEE